MTEDIEDTNETMTEDDIPNGWEYAGEDMAGNEVYEQESNEHVLLLTVNRREEFNGKCMVGLYSDTTDEPLRSEQPTTTERATTVATDMMTDV